MTARTRGQTLVLACVTMLVLALMLMLSLNITNAIHEKIRVQNHADAQAYSIAVLEARAYNSIAYSNRAIAAAFVAQMSVHAWMAIATQAAANHQAFAMAFGVVAAFETLLGCYPFNFSHCPCVFEAGIIAIRHLSKSYDVGDKVKDNEDAFNDAVEGLSDMIDSIHGEQNTIITATQAQMTQVMNKLKQHNVPGGDNSMALLAFNTGNFTCPLEGTSSGGSGGDCTGSTKDKEERSKIMASVANGTRNSFTSGGLGMTGHIGTDYFMMSDYLDDLQHNSGTNIIYFGVRGAVGQSNNGNASQGHQLQRASAGTTGPVVTVLGWRHTPVAAGTRSSYVASDHESGAHSPGLAHDPDHDKLPYCAQEDCFVNFKLGSADSDYNQPSTYGAATQDLRWAPGKKPWELNDSGKMTMKLDKGADMSLTLVPTQNAVGVGKGKVYFHQLGNWRVPPNLFDPFWRAKLHGFKDRTELNKIAGAAGGKMFVGPVEGIE